jgi:hypothetical protein
MTKLEFEDLLLRAGKLARDWDFFLIGSQALRGVCEAIPRDFPKTLEADLYPRNHPQAWGLLRDGLGKRSRFFYRKGYYLDCTDPVLATLPEGWMARLIAFRTPRTGGVTAWCLEPHDLFAAKLAAWRPKDQLFLAAMLRHKFAKPAVVKKRVAELPVSVAQKNEMLAALAQLVAANRREMRARKK